MKAVIISVVGLFLAIGAQAQNNCATPYADHTQNVVPKCLANTHIQLPNYADPTTFYKCQGSSSVLTKCPANQYFSYVLQDCTPCAEFIPAVQCSALTVNVECQPMNTPSPGGNTPAPGTTAGPTTITTKATPSTKAPATVTTSAPTTTTTAMPGPPTDSTTTVSPGGETSGTTVFVPMPPSPNEGPTPPGPDPTVPNLPSGPPVINS
ncbi:peritrophin-55 [Drosophila innubila]|uniref:peritrophin-55 n=1 Tax=Drosophila innubila TaxID=198719 RepID=UPI00148B5B74|nr:peritrophin-55 [Drosophila innubila]